MSLGERLLEFRKAKQLSQEEVADKLNVTRQTVSKWETDQSTPDFDKIVPLCELYNVSSEELLTGKSTVNNENNSIDEDNNINKKAKGIGLGVLLYFVALAWIMISFPVMMINPIVSAAVFLLICGVATYIIVYTCIVYKKKTERKVDKKYTLRKQVESIIACFFAIAYLIISFTTGAWHITWILWVVMGLVFEIVKLIFMLRGDKDEE